MINLKSMIYVTLIKSLVCNMFYFLYDYNHYNTVQPILNNPMNNLSIANFERPLPPPPCNTTDAMVANTVLLIREFNVFNVMRRQKTLFIVHSSTLLFSMIVSFDVFGQQNTTRVTCYGLHA